MFFIFFSEQERASAPPSDRYRSEAEIPVASGFGEILNRIRFHDHMRRHTIKDKHSFSKPLSGL